MKSMSKVMFVIIFLASLSFANMCYQETANASTILDGNCGLFYNGTYALESTTNGPNTYDGAIYINYTKPILANNYSIWQVKAEGAVINVYTPRNISIPLDCWNQSNLQLRIHALQFFPGFWGRVDLQCYNDTGWEPIDSSPQWGVGAWSGTIGLGSSAFDGNWSSFAVNYYDWYGEVSEGAAVSDRVYEEAMYWNVTTEVNSCQDLNVSGVTYTINESFKATGGNCLNITANHTTLNGNGLSITGIGSESGIVIKAFNATVKNVYAINNFSVGINISNSNSTIFNSSAYNNTYGTYSSNSNYNKIFNNTVYNNSYGFYFDGCDSINLTDNKAFNNIYDGINFGGTGGGPGGESDNNIIKNNLIYLNNKGISYALGTGTNIINNTVYNNSIGFYMSSPSNHYVSNNTFFSNSQYGAYLLNWRLNANLSNAHIYNNTVDIYADFGLQVGYFDNVTIDNPLGNFENYTSISLVNIGDADIYNFSWQRAPSSTQANYNNLNKYLNVSGSGQLDSVIWNYLGSTFSSNPAVEDQIDIYNWTGTQWLKMNASIDMTNKKINISNLGSGQYALLSYPTNCFQTLNIYNRTGTKTIEYGDSLIYANSTNEINNTCTHNAINTFYNWTDGNATISTTYANITAATPTNKTVSFTFPVVTTLSTLGSQSPFTYSSTMIYTFAESLGNNVSATLRFPKPTASYISIEVWKCENVSCPYNNVSWNLTDYNIIGGLIEANGTIDDIKFAISYSESTGGGSPETPPEPPPEPPPTPPPETPPNTFTPIAGDSTPLVQEIKSLSPTIESIKFTCEPVVSNIIPFPGAVTIDEIICNTQGFFSIYYTHLGSPINMAVILLVVLIILLTKTEAGTVRTATTVALGIVVVFGFDFIAFSLTAAILALQKIIGGATT